MTTKQGARRLSTIGALVALLLAIGTAAAAGAAPEWRLTVVAPDDIPVGQRIIVDGVVENVGSVPLTGSLTIVDTFPAGIAPVDPLIIGGSSSSCSIVDQTSTCTVDVEGLPPDAQVRFTYQPFVEPSASGTLLNTISVEGGGMSTAASEQQVMTVAPPGPFEVRDFAMTLVDAAGEPATRAGVAPAEITNSMAFRSAASRMYDFPFALVTAPSEHLKDVVVHTPAGLVGNPNATPVKCTAGQLTQPSPSSPDQTIPNCPQESQIGIARVYSMFGPDIAPLYNMVPRPGAPAEFGFAYRNITVALVARLRPTDYGIDIVSLNTPSTLPINGVGVTLWGVPADSSHDWLRHLCNTGLGGNVGGATCPSSAPRTPFLRMPTSCSGSPLPWSADLNTYEQPNRFLHVTTTSPALTNASCQVVPFNPTFSLAPTDPRPHVPTGVDVTLALPQDASATGAWQADLRTASVTLPAGLSINPSSADGLKACTDEQLRLGVDGVATCPDASKLGTVTLTTPLVDHALSGSIFLRTQASDNPLSGDLFRIAIEVRSDDDGIDLKLPGGIRADPVTGQLTTVFDQLPQLPFSTMNLRFKSGPRAPLTSPRTCGAYATTATLVSWSEKLVPTVSPFEVSGDGRDAACARPTFTPAFEAGSQKPLAGKSSPFFVALSRDDEDELLGKLSVKAPKGLLGRIKDVDLCSAAAADAGSCGAGSLVGRATVGAGTGPNPFFITDGKVYLTGPYRGAPYGLSVVTKAVAGPFDLGTVVVRAAVHLDKRTAQLNVVSDALPTIVKGVPLNLREVWINIDKPGFMVAPTNCRRTQVAGTATSTDGSSAPLSAPYQMANCKNLQFAPRLSMRVGSRGQTRPRGAPPLVTTIRQARGQSNLAGVKVSLPTVLNSRLSVVRRACTMAQFEAEAEQCRRAQVGRATAVTPLLKDPLRGAAYLVKDPRGGLPDLMLALRGDVELDVFGEVEIPRSNRIVANFKTIPDAPISRFSLRLFGGRNGPIGVVSNLCGKRAQRSKIAITMTGQNGDVIAKQQPLRIKGCGASARRR